MKRTCLVTLILLICVSCEVNQKAPQLGAIGQQAMVVSAHPLATKAGLEIIRQGGNVFDAATTIQFMLAVVYPRAGNIGGGGFAVYRLNNGETGALDFREYAPENAYETMFLDEDGNVIDEKSTLGHLAAAIPGSVAGTWDLHSKYGSLDWGKLIQPAIDIAFDGFQITEDEATALNEKQKDFAKANDHEPWPIKQSGWRAGDLILQKQLAATLSFIRDRGRDGFYQGIVADQLVKEMRRGGGIITKADLINYTTRWRTPVETTYKDYRIISMPPPSSGGVALMQLLIGAQQMELGKYPHNSWQSVHTMAEIERRVFADRAMHMGDPDFYDIPLNMLFDPQYNQQRFSTIALQRASSSEEIAAGELPSNESNETTHYSIVDAEGNALSITTTLNGNYGSKVMVEGAGFFLNNIMDDFSIKPGTPNMFGLVGGTANAIAPGKRMLSSMTPTLVEKDGQLKMVLGSPGGPTIITSVFQAIINIIDYNMTMQEAVNAKRIHHQWIPDHILVEEGALDEDILDELKSMGHTISFRDKIGRMDCILIMEDGSMEGAADYTRGDDYAEGF